MALSIFEIKSVGPGFKPQHEYTFFSPCDILVAQCCSKTASFCMKDYENKSFSRSGEELEIRDESQLSTGNFNSGGRIAQSVEPR